MSWGAQYFHCQNKEEAQALAQAHFNCQAGHLRVAMVHEATDLSPGLALALYGDTPEAMAQAENMDGAVRIAYREDGTWVERYPSRGRGAALARLDAGEYVARKQITGLEMAPLTLVLDAGIGMARIGPAQPERVLDQDLAVRISADEMEASASLLPPDPGGAMLDEQGVAARLTELGVCFGHNAMAIKYMLSEQRYDKSYVVAKGKRPRDGENGSIKLHFRTTLTAAPQVIDEKRDRVDFRSLDLFEPVKAEQLLASRILSTPGEPGQTVTGTELPPKPGKDVVLPRGRGITYDEAKMNIYAQTAGMVTFTRGSINVDNVYTIRENCDLSTGNINFDGNVEIRGNVIQGMVVKATGNIVVGGVVEGATLEAGGDIVLKLGIQGMDRGHLVAKGDITAQFIERAKVTVSGSLTADSIIHSNLEVGAVLTVRGKRGMLVGGGAKVAREAIVQTLGSTTQTATYVEVGVLPGTRSRIEELNAEINRLTAEIKKMAMVGFYLERQEHLDEGRAKLYNSIGESTFYYGQLLQEYTDERDTLVREVDGAVEGKVHVLGSAYPGTRLGIASARLKLEQEIPFATFRYYEGEITYGACEVSRN